MQNIRIRNNKPYADEDSLHINRLSRNARKYILQNAGKSLDLEEKFNLLIKYYTRYANCPPPVDGSEFLRICNKNRFDPALALAQAFVESRIGTGGGLSEVTKNMMNIGNWNTEKGNKRKAFKSWEDGIAAYCQQMKRYFPHRAEDLFKNNFARSNDNKKYAADLDYTKKVKREYNFIKRFLDGNTPSSLAKFIQGSVN